MPHSGPIEDFYGEDVFLVYGEPDPIYAEVIAQQWYGHDAKLCIGPVERFRILPLEADDGSPLTLDYNRSENIRGSFKGRLVRVCDGGH